MKLILDEREHDLYEKCYSIINTEGNTTSIQLIKQVLPIGDILIKTDEDKEVLIIERKKFSDLFASIKDGRYEEQSYRLKHSSGFPAHSIIYLLEGMFSELKSITEKKLMYSTMTSLNFFKGFSVIRTATVRESAEYMVWMANKIDREFVKGKIPYYLCKPTHSLLNGEPKEENADASPPIHSEQKNMENVMVDQTTADYCKVVKKVKKDNITPENIGEIILSQIPGISSINAIAIMKNFDSFPHFLEEIKQKKDILENLSIDNHGKKRKINKNIIENIKKYFLSEKTTESTVFTQN